MEYVGQFAIIHLFLHVICICIAYWALHSLRLDQFLKRIFNTTASVYDFLSNFNGYCSK